MKIYVLWRSMIGSEKMRALSHSSDLFTKQTNERESVQHTVDSAAMPRLAKYCGKPVVLPQSSLVAHQTL